jgi:hypothetical protein
MPPRYPTTSAFSELATLYADALTARKRWNADLHLALADRLELQALFETTDFLVPDRERSHAGYLVGGLDSYRIYVPFHLAEGLPQPPLLRELIATLDEMKFSEDGVICLSGSATFLASLDAIADIDAAEYVYDPPRLWPENFNRLLARKFVRAVLISTHVDRANPHYPFEAARAALVKRCEGRAFPTRRDVIFFQFVALQGQQAPIGASNKAMGVGRRSGLGGGASSYVFQEIVLAKGDVPPRTLIAPKELGNYLNFLRDASKRALDEKNALKAAKRLLSLARLIDEQPLGDALVAILNAYAGETRRQAIEKARELLALVPSDVKATRGIDIAAMPVFDPTGTLPSGAAQAVSSIRDRLEARFKVPRPSIRSHR